MGQRSVYDPRDPWAFRNTWTGEIRNSYEELWIWITLTVGVTMLMLALLIPLLAHRYCRDACYCQGCCRFMDRLILVIRTMDKQKTRKAMERRERKRADDIEYGPPEAVTHDVKMQLRHGRSPSRAGSRHSVRRPTRQRSPRDPLPRDHAYFSHSHVPYQSHHHQHVHIIPSQSYPASFYPRSHSLPRPRRKERQPVRRHHSIERPPVPRIALSQLGKK